LATICEVILRLIASTFASFHFLAPSALCADAQTAEGARKWNDANVLAMSLRMTSQIVAKEILEAWFNTSPEEDEKTNIDKVQEIEKKYYR